jgi:hypothetical protein
VERTCSVDDCTKPVLARNLCRKHYQWAWKNGFTEPLPPEAAKPLRHSLTSIDPETKTAVCAICGPTKIRYRIGKTSECLTLRRKAWVPKDPVSRVERRRRGWLKRYGMTVADYDALFASQGNRCAVCRRKRLEGERAFAVDHCHTGGAVRGILCKDCNFALGHAKDNPKTLRALARYLDRAQQGALFWEGAIDGDDTTELSA